MDKDKFVNEKCDKMEKNDIVGQLEEMARNLEYFEKDSKWFDKNYGNLREKYKGNLILIKD
jgi:hypothetical protein